MRIEDLEDLVPHFIEGVNRDEERKSMASTLSASRLYKPIPGRATFADFVTSSCLDKSGQRSGFRVVIAAFLLRTPISKRSLRIAESCCRTMASVIEALIAVTSRAPEPC